ncbi:hypothetical protein VNI00_017890 [Paramarasmius palmivorus]|uniref:Uncharacterized protein n=1 Tax=Paramarasmius palmivorus TaxID=297713 RepID=A0AAW0B3X5_9AGAR
MVGLSLVYTIRSFNTAIIPLIIFWKIALASACPIPVNLTLDILSCDTSATNLSSADIDTDVSSITPSSTDIATSTTKSLIPIGIPDVTLTAPDIIFTVPVSVPPISLPTDLSSVLNVSSIISSPPLPTTDTKQTL